MNAQFFTYKSIWALNSPIISLRALHRILLPNFQICVDVWGYRNPKTMLPHHHSFGILSLLLIILDHLTVLILPQSCQHRVISQTFVNHVHSLDDFWFVVSVLEDGIHDYFWFVSSLRNIIERVVCPGIRTFKYNRLHVSWAQLLELSPRK